MSVSPKFGIKTNKLEVFDLLGVKPIANSNNCFINGILINNGK
jgi:hypothetical protein